MTDSRADSIAGTKNDDANPSLVDSLTLNEHPRKHSTSSFSNPSGSLGDSTTLAMSHLIHAAPQKEHDTKSTAQSSGDLAAKNGVTNQPTKTPTLSPLRVPSMPTASDFELHSLDYSLISTMGPPVENRSINDFIIQERLPKPTFHVVCSAIEKNQDELRVVYFKENTPNSPLSELETVCAAFYRFIAPDHVPSTRAVYEEKDGAITYRGLVSSEVQNFQPVAVDPLQEEDLNISHLAERNLFALLDDFDGKLRELEKEFYEFERRKKKLVDDEKQLQIRIQQKRAVGSAANLKELDELDALSLQLDNISNASAKNINMQHALYTNLFKTNNVTKVEFERYRTVKGLAIGMTSSYIFAEDDLHQNNISKDGKRIDFDMSLWPILYELKKNGVIDWAFRSPGKTALDVTQHDIIHFPNLKDVVPFYWPTNPAPIIPESAMAILKKIIPVSMSTNAYPAQANSIYRKLEKNPVFVYHKFATLLKYILTNGDMYRHITLLHMRIECKFQHKFMIDTLAQFQAKRIQNFKDILFSMPEFSEFMSQHGEVIFNRITENFTLQNEQYEKQVALIEEELASLNEHSINISEMNSSLLSKLTNSSTEEMKAFQYASPPVIDEKYNCNLSKSKEKQLQQQREEVRLQFELLNKNDKSLKKIASDIRRKETMRDVYSNQQIDMNYVNTMYENMRNRSKNITVVSGKEQRARLRRANSLPDNITSIVAPTSASTPASTSVTVVSTPSLFSLNLSSSSSAVVNSAKPISYIAVKDKVLQSMTQYICPGIWGLGGIMRHQRPLAEEIQQHCNSLTPDPANFAENILAIESLRHKLMEAKAKLTSGGLLIALINLLDDEALNINKSAPTTTNKNTNLSTYQ